MAETIPELLTSKTITSAKGIFYLSEPAALSGVEDLYSKVREKEGRIYPDSVVKILPDVQSNHPLYREWQIRGKSSNKLVSYLTKRQEPRTILDLGCGNGWLANRLAQIPQSRVYAIDLNKPELEQGARVFSETAFLHFIYGDIFDDIFQPASFDIVLLASSVQYFNKLGILLPRLLELLEQRGEIHIMDSPFYSQKSATAARQRSIDYYQKLGYPQMAEHYYHHCWSELAGFHYEIKYRLRNYSRALQRFQKEVIAPFPWIVIQK